MKVDVRAALPRLRLLSEQERRISVEACDRQQRRVEFQSRHVGRAATCRVFATLSVVVGTFPSAAGLPSRVVFKVYVEVWVSA